MSAFWTTCRKCGERYFHMFVGKRLLSGHECSEEALMAEGYRATYDVDREIAESWLPIYGSTDDTDRRR